MTAAPTMPEYVHLRIEIDCGDTLRWLAAAAVVHRRRCMTMPPHDNHECVDVRHAQLMRIASRHFGLPARFQIAIATALEDMLDEATHIDFAAYHEMQHMAAYRALALNEIQRISDRN